MFSQTNINRLVIVALLWAAAIITIQARLVKLQVFSAKNFKQRAIGQQRKSKDIPARRGSIYDRNGKLLATDNYFFDIYADPQQLENLDEADSILCQVFYRPTGYYLSKILPCIHRRFVYLERTVDMQTAKKLKSCKLHGIYMTPLYSRSYPFGATASTVLGCVDQDRKGIAGLEVMYDSVLAGIPTQKLIFTDAHGQDYTLLCYSTGEPIPGDDLYLTIDIELQQVLESELKKAIEVNDAASACGILINPNTGEVLALASLPDFDPNEYVKYPLEMRKNRNVTDPYEPGSIFKLVTFAAALAENLITIQDTVDTKRGIIELCGREVSDVHAIGKVTAADVIIKSSNVGIVLIAQALEKVKFYEYIRKFGFGTLTNIDLSAESNGILRPPGKWWGTSMATLPMGYELSATPIQIACAYGAVANDGVLMRPYLVKEIQKFHGRVVCHRNPLKVRQVVPKWVADTLTYLFRCVVTEGTGTKANSDVIEIAGKTGTSHKSLVGELGYHENQYYSSFVGYAPYDEPYVVGLIVVDNPQAGFYYGGTVAAPVFKSVLEKAISAGIFPAPAAQKLYVHKRSNNDLVSIPNLVRTAPEQALQLLAMRNLDAKFYGSGDIIIDQSPEPGRGVEPGTVIILHLRQLPVEQRDTIVVPDVIGYSLRKAIEIMADSGVPFRVEGSGVVASQLPPPNSITDSNMVCVLLCKAKSESFDIKDENVVDTGSK